VGRPRELSFLVDSILRRNNGSVLVSGARGVGKTALVYRALWKMVQEASKTVCAVLNISDLEIEIGKNAPQTKSSLAIRLNIVQNLIRRLYASLMEHSDAILESDLAKLYMKATACKTVEKEILDSEAAGRGLMSRRITRTLRSPINIGALVVPFVLGAWLTLYPPWPSSSGLLDILNRIVPLLVAMIGPITFLYVRETIEESETATRERMKASQYYEFDAGLSTLQFDLERCLERLREMGYKVVFCIDELDKIENSQLVIDIITSFKNLFNLSCAIFIVITGPEEYTLVDAAKGARGIHYTLFTNKIFVSRPSFADLEGFLDEIVAEPDARTLARNALYNEFRNYVCYTAASDFFDLYGVIRDFVTGYDSKGRPILEITALSEDEKTKARLQKCLGLVFDRYRESQVSRWAYNDALLTDLYAFVSWLLSQQANATFNDEFPDIKNETFREARRDLCTYLARAEALRLVGHLPTGRNNYTWAGSCPPVPSRIESPLLYEKEFVERYDALIEGILTCTNVYLSATLQPILSKKDFESDYNGVLTVTTKALEADFKSVFAQQKPFYDDLHSDFPKAYPRDQLHGFSEILKAQYEVLPTRKFVLFKNMMRDSLTGANVALLTDNVALFSTVDDLRKAVIESKVQHAVVLKGDLSKQILIAKDVAVGILTRNRGALRQNSRVLQVVNVQTESGVEHIDMKGFTNLDLSRDVETAPRLVQGLKRWFEK
jgi:Cdc6-like AAA superfamily ATPase